MSAVAIDVLVVYKDGVLKPEGDARSADALRDRARYRAHLEPVDSGVEATDDRTSWEEIDRLVGFIKDGPTEPIGREHDKHLYGFTK